MKRFLIAVLLLSACAPRLTVIETIQRHQNICFNNAKAGHIKSAVELVDCEATPVMAIARTSGFSQQNRLLQYYADQFHIAGMYDDGKISKETAGGEAQRIQAEYRDLFNAQDSGASIESASTYLGNNMPPAWAFYLMN